LCAKRWKFTIECLPGDKKPAELALCGFSGNAGQLLQAGGGDGVIRIACRKPLKQRLFIIPSSNVPSKMPPLPPVLAVTGAPTMGGGG
jgi:hypothetical protein